MGVSKPSIVLFICIGIVIITIPFLTGLAVCYNKFNHRRNRTTPNATDHRLRQLKLQPTAPNPNASPRSLNGVHGDLESNVEHITRSEELPKTSRTPRMFSRLSRPLDLPIRLSTLEPRRSISPRASSKPMPALARSSSKKSLISAVTSIGSTDNSEVSPISSLTSSSLSSPPPTHQPDYHRPRKGHINYDHDLFIRAGPSIITNSTQQAPLGRTPRKRAAKARIQEGPNANGIKMMQRMYQPENRIEHEEWKETRIETVDGILAPREWV